MILQWPVDDSPALQELKDKGCTLAYNYLLWLRRSQTVHITSFEYKVAYGMLIKSMLAFYAKDPSKFQLAQIRAAEQLLSVSTPGKQK